MKRLALIAFGLVVVLLAACAPQPTVVTNVPVTLISVTPSTASANTLVLQGRYFGDGRTGGEDVNYVLIGANAQGEGGQKAQVLDWTPTRITVSRPQTGGHGWVFVVAGGVTSNGLPTSAP